MFALLEAMSAFTEHLDRIVAEDANLVRELAVIAVHVGRSGSASTFAYFQIENIADIKKRFGLLAGEAAIRETAEMLKVHLRETDRIGTLGGDGFGIILALSDEKTSLEKIRKLTTVVEQGPVMHDGRVLDLKIAYGLHPIHAGVEALEVMQAADDNLRRRFVRQ